MATSINDRLANMPPINSDMDQVWSYLYEGVHQIMQDPSVKIEPRAYAAIYSVVFNSLTSSRLPLARNGEDVYGRLEKYLKQHLAEVIKKATELGGISLVQYYAMEWDQYIAGSKQVSRLFAYLNRPAAQAAARRANSRVYPIDNLALVVWRESFFSDTLHPGARIKLLKALDNLATLHHDGEEGDHDLLKKAVDSLFALGLDKPAINGDKTSEDWAKSLREISERIERNDESKAEFGDNLAGLAGSVIL